MPLRWLWVLAPLAAIALDLEPKVRLEFAGLDLAAEVAQVAQRVVDGLRALALGTQSAFEFVEHGLALALRDLRQVPIRRLPLLWGKPLGVGERQRSGIRVRISNAGRLWCCCWF